MVIVVAMLSFMVLEAATQETVILMMGVLQSMENADHCSQATRHALEHRSTAAVVSTAITEAQVHIVPAAIISQEPAQRESRFLRAEVGMRSRRRIIIGC